MNAQELLSELNIAKQAKKYGIPLWQHPQFLFLVMGLLIASSSFLSYLLGTRYIEDPHVVALAVIILTLVLFMIAIVIERSFERLAEASRLKSEFVAIVSHQLRAPLSNMKWIADLLLSKKGSKVQREYFQMLQDNASRMQEIVNDLLTVSRIEEGGLATLKKEFIFQHVLSGVVASFQPMIRASNIALRVEAPKEPQKVFADPLQIRQVLSNLLDNAVKYTKKSKDTAKKSEDEEHIITMRVKRKDKSLYFEIEDAGVGIPKEDQKYLFQKFFRSGNALSQETQGSGLGLYIAKAIIARSKGKMGFDSKEHKGSRFWFTVPYAS